MVSFPELPAASDQTATHTRVILGKRSEVVNVTEPAQPQIISSVVLLNLGRREPAVLRGRFGHGEKGDVAVGMAGGRRVVADVRTVL